MTFAEFKKKWSRYTGKESSAYQEHFNDLCRLLGQPSLPCRHGALPTLIAKGRRLRRQAEKAHAPKLYNERPAWLDLGHKKLDAAVAAAYGFPADLTDEQILERLLALNLERAAEEEKAAKVKKPKATREKRADEMI